MPLRHTLTLTLAATCLVDWSFATPSSLSIKEDFSGNRLPVSLEDASDRFIIEDGTIRLASSADSSDRCYIRTRRTDYLAYDFTVGVTFTLSDFNWSGEESGVITFFGIGSGEGTGPYREVVKSLHARIHSTRFAYGAGGRVDVVSAWSVPHDLRGGKDIHRITRDKGTHRAEIIKLGNTMTFSLDVDYNGTFMPDVSYTVDDIAALAPWLDKTNSRIFFGTSSPIDTFDDFEIRLVQQQASANATPETPNAQKRAPIEHKLAAIVVPQIDFEEATLHQVVDFLRNTCRELDSGDGQGINFVVLSAADTQSMEEWGRETITIKARNISAGEVLRLACKMSGAGYEVTEYAVLVEEKPNSAAANAPYTPPHVKKPANAPVVKVAAPAPRTMPSIATAENSERYNEMFKRTATRYGLPFPLPKATCSPNELVQLSRTRTMETVLAKLGRFDEAAARKTAEQNMALWKVNDQVEIKDRRSMVRKGKIIAASPREVKLSKDGMLYTYRPIDFTDAIRIHIDPKANARAIDEVVEAERKRHTRKLADAATELYPEIAGQTAAELGFVRLKDEWVQGQRAQDFVYVETVRTAGAMAAELENVVDVRRAMIRDAIYGAQFNGYRAMFLSTALLLDADPEVLWYLSIAYDPNRWITAIRGTYKPLEAEAAVFAKAWAILAAEQNVEEAAAYVMAVGETTGDYTKPRMSYEDHKLAEEMAKLMRESIDAVRMVDREGILLEETKIALREVVFPEIDWQGATLRQALIEIQQRIVEHYPGKPPVNIASISGRVSRQVNLRLTNATLDVLIEQLCDVANLNFIVERGIVLLYDQINQPSAYEEAKNPVTVSSSPSPSNHLSFSGTWIQDDGSLITVTQPGERWKATYHFRQPNGSVIRGSVAGTVNRSGEIQARFVFTNGWIPASFSGKIAPDGNRVVGRLSSQGKSWSWKKAK